MEDILIAPIDRLREFPDAIHSVFPNTIVQGYIIYQIRNTSKYVSYKNNKEFLGDLKLVYTAINKETAEGALDDLDKKRGKKDPIVIKSWRENWSELSKFFQFTQSIRKLIYTTNAVEGYHRQIRKVIKNRGVFPSDKVLEKLVFLAYKIVLKKGKL